MRVRIGAYARISLDDENDQLGVGRQCKDIDALAQLRGWDVHDYYVDNNISAYKSNVEREQFNRLLTDLENGKIDGVVVYDIDRLVRQPLDLEKVISIYEKREGLIFATIQGSIDLSTPDGLTMARVMVVFANKSSMDTSRRIKRKNLERAEMGLPHGSRRPFGYQKDQLHIEPEEAALIRRMADKLLGGESYKEIAYWLNESGYRTTTGQLWYPITIRNLLTRPRYGGIRLYKGREYDGVWEPVFSQTEWQALQDVIKERRSRYAHTPKGRKYALTGLAVCGKCGLHLNGATKRDSPGRPLRRTYYCRISGDAQRGRGCGGVVRNATALEHFIRELICARLDGPELASLLEQTNDNEQLTSTLTEREAAVRRKDALVDDYADGVLSKADLVRAQARLDARIGVLDTQLDELRIKRLNVALRAGETVREAWNNHGNEWKLHLASTLIEKIVVNVGKTKPYYDVDGVWHRFDPALIDVVWKV